MFANWKGLDEVGERVLNNLKFDEAVPRKRFFLTISAAVDDALLEMWYVCVRLGQVRLGLGLADASVGTRYYPFLPPIKPLQSTVHSAPNHCREQTPAKRHISLTPSWSAAAGLNERVNQK